MPSSDSATDRFTVRLKAGDYAFREGDAGAALFVIEEGRVELTSSAAPQHIEVLEVGDFFGTASLFANDRVREISARATAPSRLLRIDRTAFNEIVRAQPEIALVMLRRVTERAAREETLAAPELEVGHLTHVLSGYALHARWRRARHRPPLREHCPGRRSDGAGSGQDAEPATCAHLPHGLRLRVEGRGRPQRDVREWRPPGGWPGGEARGRRSRAVRPRRARVPDPLTGPPLPDSRATAFGRAFAIDAR